MVAQILINNIQGANDMDAERNNILVELNCVHAYLVKLKDATPMDLVKMERQGVSGSVLKELSDMMAVSLTRMHRILGVPSRTAKNKPVSNEQVAGSAGFAAIGMIKLVALAGQIASDSSLVEGGAFNAPTWLGLWIERPQPALGGRKPADLVGTPTGIALVGRLLGSVQSGAYQ